MGGWCVAGTKRAKGAEKEGSGKAAVEKGPSLADLYRRPGFLIRRAHQISVSLFMEEIGDLGVTTTQYGAMVVLSKRSDLDQAGLATLVGIDRSTTALVVSKLEQFGYLVRQDDPADKRRKVLALTDTGHEILKRTTPRARKAQNRALEAFDDKEDAKKFIELLEHFVDTFNSETRAPIYSRRQG